MKRTEWFNRTFPTITDNGLFPSILERLEGTAARLKNKVSKLKTDLTAFEEARDQLLKVLREVSEQDLEKSATHPRLGTPMKLIDLAFFVAEHDDHHLAQISYLDSVNMGN